MEMPSATSVNLPPGFRFRPSDEEIVGYYLKNKVAGHKIKFDVIREVDLYKCEPWDLPEKSFLPSRDLEWYFFSPRDKKYPNGSRSNRATEAGYWKATGKDRKVSSQSNKIGMKKTLVFYKGRAPNGERTDWLMHEYRLDESQCKEGDKDQYVLCRVFKKGKQGSFNPENYGEENREIYLPILKSSCSPGTASEDDAEEISEERSSPIVPEDERPASSGLPSEISSEIIENKIEDNNCIEGPLNFPNKTSDAADSTMPSHQVESHMKNDPDEAFAQFFNSLEFDSLFDPYPAHIHGLLNLDSYDPPFQHDELINYSNENMGPFIVNRWDETASGLEPSSSVFEGFDDDSFNYGNVNHRVRLHIPSNSAKSKIMGQHADSLSNAMDNEGKTHAIMEPGFEVPVAYVESMPISVKETADRIEIEEDGKVYTDVLQGSGLKRLIANTAPFNGHKNPELLGSDSDSKSDTNESHSLKGKDNNGVPSGLRARRKSPKTKSCDSARQVHFRGTYSDVCAKEAKQGFCYLMKSLDIFRLLSKIQRKLTKHVGRILVLFFLFISLALVIGILNKLPFGRNLFQGIS